jgi:phage terminase small subunit
MPALTNRRRELFAQGVASGVSLKQAAVSAGYSLRRAEQTGSELRKNREIAVRIGEIRAVITESITRFMTYTLAQAMLEAHEAWELARNNGQPGQMIAATTLKSKLMGLLVERRDVTYRSVDELSDAELENLIADAEGSANTDGLTH